jgi:hypothetical protein
MDRPGASIKLIGCLPALPPIPLLRNHTTTVLSQSKLLDRPLQFTLPAMRSNIRRSSCENALSWPESDDRRKKLVKKLSAESAFRRSWMPWDLHPRRRLRRRSLQISPRRLCTLHIFNSGRTPECRPKPRPRPKRMAITQLLYSNRRTRMVRQDTLPKAPEPLPGAYHIARKLSPLSFGEQLQLPGRTEPFRPGVQVRSQRLEMSGAPLTTTEALATVLSTRILAACLWITAQVHKEARDRHLLLLLMLHSSLHKVDNSPRHLLVPDLRGTVPPALAPHKDLT